MVEIDLKKIRSIISNYNDILDQLKDNNTDVIHQFNELTKVWNDQKRLRLTSNFNLEQRRILRLENNVIQQINIYKYLEKEYEKIGRKVKCNLDARDLLNEKLDRIINKLNSIINNYENIGNISFYSRAYLIYNQKRDMKSILKSFENIKKDLNNKFEQIEDVEKQVSEALSSVKVETFVANNYESED
ncbi:MAG: hypothetical protein IKE63_03880 [Bacilli bacterium]|nr:hypothetical protein [Bacilli bacterium]